MPMALHTSPKIPTIIRVHIDRNEMLFVCSSDAPTEPSIEGIDDAVEDPADRARPPRQDWAKITGENSSVGLLPGTWLVAHSRKTWIRSNYNATTLQRCSI
jgi:hypothetical protein